MVSSTACCCSLNAAARPCLVQCTDAPVHASDYVLGRCSAGGARRPSPGHSQRRVRRQARGAVGEDPVHALGHGARSWPAEEAAAFYKTFARHGCTMVVQGMDVCMNKHHHSTGSSPNNLLVQMKNACRRHGARIAGENASLVMTHTSSSLRIRSNILTTVLMMPCHFLAGTVHA
ncbi:unnamed protein product [Miscanthus lutarioriparius]|uniref:Beta-amylase n=1 Tax=Miscanthus lutarioriparius TaxID=422564 RepID=A0A811R7W4_9POAL|nr:unnamed protein product [Miscanthus lutarioriparius]